MSAIEVNHLSFSYKGSDKLILKDIHIKIAEGDFICLLGQSGCGKSTLLRLLAGLERPTAGEILIDGRKIEGAGLQRSVVFQDYGLFPWMSVGKNIMLALGQKYKKEKSKEELKRIAIEMLEKVRLEEEVFYKFPKELSGGMKQRCAIARSFGIDAPVLLMDEPFGALDAVTRAKLQDMISELWQSENKQKSVFFVTHDVDEAVLLANRIIVLGQTPGHVIYECRIPREKKAGRNHFYENEYMISLRNELMKCLNQDVEGRIHA